MPPSLAIEVALLTVIEELQAVVEQLLIKVDGMNSAGATLQEHPHLNYEML